MSLSHHTLKQLKFILPGATITCYLRTHNQVWRLATGEAGIEGWGRWAAAGSLFSAVVTVSLFLYILMLPLLNGQQPNYRHWRQSGILSRVIPILTFSIVLGWSLLSYTLGHWTNFGYIEGLIASSGLYALSFGLLGLFPAPKVSRR